MRLVKQNKTCINSVQKASPPEESENRPSAKVFFDFGYLAVLLEYLDLYGLDLSAIEQVLLLVEVDVYSSVCHWNTKLKSSQYHLDPH